MDAPGKRIREEFITRINAVEAELKTAVDVGNIGEEAEKLQHKLNLMDKKYVDNKLLSSDIYRLYEAQAMLFYFTGNDMGTREFAEYAMSSRGQRYAKMESLLTKVGGESVEEQLSKKDLVGLKGWLAFFVVAFCLGIALTAVSGFQAMSAFNDVATLPASYESLAQNMRGLLSFEVLWNFAYVGVGIWTVVLLAQRKKLARTMVIVLLAASVVGGLIDYGWAQAIFSPYSSTFDMSDISDTKDLSRAVGGLVIWGWYFGVSRRVKATLTK